MSLQITRSTKEHTWDIPKHLIYKNEIKSEGDKLSLLQTELINLNKRLLGWKVMFQKQYRASRIF